MSGGVIFAASPHSSFMPLTVMILPGTDRPGIGVDSNGPAANATRYEGIGGEVLNDTSAIPSFSDRPDSGVFAITIRSLGTVRVSVQGILNSGSSKHGNAWRASSASNWVNRYHASPVLSR